MAEPDELGCNILFLVSEAFALRSGQNRFYSGKIEGAGDEKNFCDCIGSGQFIFL